MRAAVLVVPRPQPHLVAEEQADAALALARQHQQRLVVRPRHHGRAARRHGIDLAIPFAPARRIGLRSGQGAGDGMARALLADMGAERLLDHRAFGTRRGDLGEGGIVEPVAARIIGPHRHQQSAAVADIFDHVLEVDRGQHALVGIAVEDDEIEILDLVAEQIGDREADQGQFVGRRVVVLLRRAQDGEMDEIDIGVRLQQVAPGALAGMGFARHQQHFEFVAHAVHRHHGAVVDGGQLARQRRHFDFDDIGPAMGDADGNADVLAQRHVDFCDFHAVAPHPQRYRLAPVCRVEHARDDGLVLADDAETRGLHQLDAAIALARVAGDEDVERSLDAQSRDRGGDVVDDAVRHHHHRADALGRHIGEAGIESGEEAGAVALDAGFACRDEAGVDAGDGGQRLLQPVAGGFGLGGALADALARAFVDHDGDDVLQRLAVLAHQRGIGQRREDQGETKGAQPCAAAPRIESQRDHDKPGCRHRGQQRPWQERGKAEAEIAHQCASRSRRSRTWTWSAL